MRLDTMIGAPGQAVFAMRATALAGSATSPPGVHNRRTSRGRKRGAAVNATFSTAGMSGPRQFQYFREAICEAVARLGARRSHGGPFDAEVRTHAFGGVRFTEVHCDAVTIERTRQDIAHDSRASYFFTLQLAGTAVVSQRGRHARLSPGEFTVVDGAEPYALHFEAPVRRLVVQVDWDAFQRRVGRAVDLRAAAFDARSPGTRLVFDAWRSLQGESSAHAPAVQNALSAHVLDLAASAMLVAASRRSPGTPSDPQGALARIQAHVRANLRDPELGPQSAAIAAGVSLRRLHQLCRTSGKSFGTWLREERLDHCHREIADTSLAQRPISDIAFRYGFNDATHFSRIFRQRFGYPPSALRA